MLHEIIEKPLDPFLDPNIADRSPFFNFKSKMVNLATVTETSYRSFIDALKEFEVQQ